MYMYIYNGRRGVLSPSEPFVNLIHISIGEAIFEYTDIAIFI